MNTKKNVVKGGRRMTIQIGKIVYTGTTGTVVKCEYPPGYYMDSGRPRPKYVVEYRGDTVLRTDDLAQAKEAAA